MNTSIGRGWGRGPNGSTACLEGVSSHRKSGRTGRRGHGQRDLSCRNWQGCKGQVATGFRSHALAYLGFRLVSSVHSKLQLAVQEPPRGVFLSVSLREPICPLLWRFQAAGVLPFWLPCRCSLPTSAFLVRNGGTSFGIPYHSTSTSARVVRGGGHVLSRPRLTHR